MTPRRRNVATRTGGICYENPNDWLKQNLGQDVGGLPRLTERVCGVRLNATL